MQTSESLLKKEYGPNYIYKKNAAQNNSKFCKTLTQNELLESNLHRGNCTENCTKKIPKSKLLNAIYAKRIAGNKS